MHSTKKTKATLDRHLLLPDTLNEAAVRYNSFLLDYCQTSVSALSGSAAGIIGLTGLNGFVFYLICSIFLSIIILLYLNDSIKLYFTSKKSIITANLWSGIQTYLLFWTFLYGMVHVY
ncbi:ER membrane complex subunit 6 [Brachionus plicatilis]|uniref:ER membrane protein complex subunit 6 n=1 Tax=Brachionus plicatilis TaxID=10195 RepID=A0A3M7S4H0_BRAPC|nr:ER membrane complex subunit 6 [Brachionus plicatilis]